ncbi:MAG: rhodanese-related sulfurtransferase [Alphaproteobacteria bacterium]|nr:rhodanese-related sulfurtransferase [Alphaproteobacteria bacterium]
MKYKIAALYRFTPLAELESLRAAIRAFGSECDALCGTLLLAPEGINGTIGAAPEALDRMVEFLDREAGILQGEVKFSWSEDRPFNRFKVRLKKEIVTLRAPEADPSKQVGIYVDPAQWNALIDDPEVTLIDTRNDYETKVGIFKGAIDPDISTFTEFKDYVSDNLDPAKHKKVAMFCTGGIRCEKASSYMLAHGFEEVYHLKGGILKYLETIPADESRWEGECFVFDQRVAVGHGLKESAWSVCHGCREPLSAEDVSSAAYEKGVSCPHCIEHLTPARAEALRTRHKHYMASAYGEDSGRAES